MNILEELELVALVRYQRSVQKHGGSVLIHEWRFRVRLPDGSEHDLEKILWDKAHKDLPLLAADGTPLGKLGSREEFEQKMANLILHKGKN